MDDRPVSRTVSDLLDYLYFQIIETCPDLQPFTYTVSWVLQNTRGQEDLDDIGTLWAHRQGELSDDRLLSDVGIVPAFT